MPPRIEIVDAPNWFAVLLVTAGAAGEPDPMIRCVGFKRRQHRDTWLVWYTQSAAALFDAVPAQLR